MKTQFSKKRLLKAVWGFVFCAVLVSTGSAQIGLKPVITNQPSDRIALNNDNITFWVGALSATTMSYKWYHNSNLVSGATANSYTINSAQLNGGDAGFYQVQVINAAGSILSRAARLTILASNDVPIANNDTYTTQAGLPLIIPAAGILTNDVDVYPGTLTALLVSNPSQGILSLNPNGSFTYIPNPIHSGSDSFTYRARDGGTTILEQNSSGGGAQEIKVDEPGAQSFRHGTSGDPAYSVKKIVLRLSKRSGQTNNLNFSIGTGINSGPIAGSSYTITMASISNATDGASFQNYDIVYTTAVGPLTAGTTYYLNLDNSPNGYKVYVESPSSSTYPRGTYYQAGSDDAKDMRFEIHEETFSGIATVTLNVTPAFNSPVILTHPASQQVIPGTDARFSVDLSVSVTPLGYQWRFNGTNIPNANASVYGRTNVQLSDVGNYSVIVSNASGATPSNPATLTVDTTPVRLTSTIMTDGGLKFQASGPLLGTYIVYSSNDLESWTPISTNLVTLGILDVTISQAALKPEARGCFYRIGAR